jgi:hypothetical protein
MFRALKLILHPRLPRVVDRNCAIFLAALAFAAPPAFAADDDPSFKLTVGWYRYSDSTHGVDTNLRHTSDLGNVWLGFYRQTDPALSQWRTGWDRSFGKAVRISPSVQLASGGFAGGSIQAEAGAPWFGAVGFGRTNLRPYVNLNFDPNDSYLVAAGRRDEIGQVVMVQMIRDNRENPDQRHFHLVYRQPLDPGDRLTIDTLYKVGNVDGERIRRWGFTMTYDWPRWFVRLARDPNTNFTPVDAWRFSVGTRF